MPPIGRRLLGLAMLAALAGCAGLRRPPPREVFDTGPIAGNEAAAVARVTPNPVDDEDPTVVLARDGLFHAIWWSKQHGQVDLYARSSRDGRTWTDERRITDDLDEDYYPSLIQAADGTFHLTWFRLRRAQGRMDIWYARSMDGWRWTRPVQMTNEGQDWAPAIYEDSQRVLWIVWSSRRTSNRELFATQSTDGGHKWSPPRQLTKSPQEDDFPHLLQTANGERLLAWTRYQPHSPLRDYYRDPTAEIVVATSGDGIAWSAPTVVSPADADARYVEILPFLFTDRARNGAYVSWTSNRPGHKGDILVRDLHAPSSPVRQLTTDSASDYDAKIVPTATPGEYLMLWITTRAGSTDIFALPFHL